MKTLAAGLAGAVAGALLTAGAGRLLATPARADANPEPAPLVHPVVVTLHRFELQPDGLDRFEAWMRFHRAERSATVQTLERERTYFEAMFRDRKAAPGVIWWLEAQGEGGTRVETSPLPVDRQHRAFMEAVLKPGTHSRLDTEFVLLPDFMVEAIRVHQASEAGER